MPPRLPGRRGRVRARQGHEGALVTGSRDATAPQIIKLYSKRWTVQPSFRDTKDLRFGMGLGAVRIADPQRRDRLLLNAFAVVLLTLLGAAGESLGMISSPTPSRPIPCSAKAACSTT